MMPTEQNVMQENKLSTISQADSYKKMGEFWDTHDFTEFDGDAPDSDQEDLHGS